MAEMNYPGTNAGHGHVWQRPDGMKVRCGGPGLCGQCAFDAGRQHAVVAEPRLTAAETLTRMNADRDERDLNRRIKWFVDKWSERLDAGREEAAELSADVVTLVQAVHRDASRETHALLASALSAMPRPAILLKKD